VPFLNFAPLENAIRRLEESAEAYDGAYATAMHDHGEMTEAEYEAMATPEHVQALSELNHALMKTERAMTAEEGLPRRPWFRHQIYAPGFYTGYGVKTLPGVREAIEQRDWEEASEQIERIAGTLNGLADQIDRATGLVGG